MKNFERVRARRHPCHIVRESLLACLATHTCEKQPDDKLVETVYPTTHEKLQECWRRGASRRERSHVVAPSRPGRFELLQANQIHEPRLELHRNFCDQFQLATHSPGS